MLIQIKDQQPMNYMKYYIFGIILIILKKEKNSVIREKKSELYLKRLTKKYQKSQHHTKRILMLYTPVEHLHLIIYQNLLIHPLLQSILKQMKIIMVRIQMITYY